MSEHDLQSENLTFRLERTVDGMLAEIAYHIYGKRLDTLRYPHGWWDAFKERWFPEWAKKRWPVSYQTVSVNAYYPKLAVPDSPPVVTFTILTKKRSC